MVKIGLLPLLFLAGLFGVNNSTRHENYREYLTTTLKENGNYRLDSVENADIEEIRIYHYDDLLIDEIADNAFSGTSFSKIALSNCVKTVGTNAFAGVTSLTTMYFTGSEEEYSSLNISYEFQDVYYYAIDEGFINYWNKEVRPNEDSNICEISSDKYNYIRHLYTSLSTEDKDEVDSYKDLAGATIKDSIKELNQHFAAPGGAKKTEEWNQTGAITLILVIAVIGMTSITIFFLLKTKQIIN